MLFALYQIIIQPLVTLTEFFYVLFMEIIPIDGIAIVLLSFVVTFLTLPLYMVAEGWQEKERQIEAALEPKTARIKAVFTGDERYMMLSTLYRESRYHPIMALRSSFSLAIQVPFFIAAYNFLSNLESLKGMPFFFIVNLGAPDGWLHIGNITLNVLPLAMTAINCVSGAVYSRGHPIREKVQIYACAVLFLVLLYNSPSGLVLYWTMNNVLSLVKNVFYRIKRPRRVLYILVCLMSVLFIIAACMLIRTKAAFRLMLVLMASCLPVLPFAMKRLSSIIDCHFQVLDKDAALRVMLFVLSAAAAAILAGLVVPSMLVESEVVQFCYVDDVASPFVFIKSAFYQAVGLFFVWPACFYAMFDKRVKKALALSFVFLAFSSIINCFIFSMHYGPLDNTLLFMQPQHFSGGGKVTALNCISLIVLAIAVSMLLARKAKWLSSSMAVMLMALTAISIRNLALINKAFNNMDVPAVADKVESVFHLSRNAPNVIVVMQDKLYSPLVQELLKERPEMNKRLDGFTFYPNCVSPARVTMRGTAGVFGGYDYTPYYMNEQKDKTLQQKHNEAILTMPVLFHEAGFRTAVADLPYENYLEYPIEQMYSGYPFVERITAHGTYSDLWYKRHGIKRIPYASRIMKRDLIWFSLFKMAMPVLRRVVYHADYWMVPSGARRLSHFIDSYSELEFLKELMGIDDGEGSFMLLDNETTHDSIFLNAPDYVPVETVTNLGKGKWAYNEAYHGTAGTLMRFADFFDWMKENGVYDNTRIIIVSDHGQGPDTGVFGPRSDLPFSKYDKSAIYRKEDFVASLLVKDFSSRGRLKTDMKFMSNADTPALAVEGIIPNALNPFTKKPLAVSEEEKASRIFIAATPAESTRIRHETQFNILPGEWYKVKDNIYKAENWSRLEQ